MRDAPDCTYPVSSMTGSWSYPSLSMISRVWSTVSVGEMLRGALRSIEDTFSSYHLKKNDFDLSCNIRASSLAEVIGSLKVSQRGPKPVVQKPKNWLT